jgi:hypothetical protein
MFYRLLNGSLTALFNGSFNGYQPRGRKGYYNSDPTLIERLDVVVKSKIHFKRV